MNQQEPTRIAIRLTVRLSAANIAAALLAALLAWLVVPGAHAPTGVGALAVNAVVLVAYITLTVAVAHRWALRRIASTSRWLRNNERLPSVEQRQLLLTPLHTSRLVALQWLGALVLFSALNVSRSTQFVLAAGASITFTGLAMCAVAYLATERLLRPLYARILGAGEHEDVPVGVAARQLLGWTLGTGSAVFGLLTIGLTALLRPRADSHGLAVAIVVFCIIALAGGLLVEFLAAQAISSPLQRLRRAVIQVGEGQLSVDVDIDDSTEVGRLQQGFNAMLAGLRERERVRRTFGRHVGEDVARHAMTTDGSQLGGKTQDICTLFVDLADSTGLAANRPGEEVITLLNRFFAVVVEVVENHGGSINKFQGDAALAIFGAPEPSAHSASQALSAARQLAGRLHSDVPELSFGIGVSSGPAVAGNLGSEHRLEYTVVGDPVNEAARLTELAKDIPGAVAASSDVVNAAPQEEAINWHPHDEQVLRGRTRATQILAISPTTRASPARQHDHGSRSGTASPHPPV